MASMSTIKTKYLIYFFRKLAPKLNVIAVCQPAPLALAATAFLTEEDKNIDFFDQKSLISH